MGLLESFPCSVGEGQYACTRQQRRRVSVRYIVQKVHEENVAGLDVSFDGDVPRPLIHYSHGGVIFGDLKPNMGCVLLEAPNSSVAQMVFPGGDVNLDSFRPSFAMRRAFSFDVA